MATLIERLQERAHDPERATDEGHGICDRKGNPVPYVANPPLSEREVTQWEQAHGITLPSLLRDIYLQVGDGGFGPGYGLKRLKDCHVSHSIVLPAGQTAENCLWICHWGCGITSFVNCSQVDAPVFRLDPNQTPEDVQPGIAFGADSEHNVVYAEYDSLEGWLDAWVMGQELFFSTYGLDANDCMNEV